MTMNVSCYSFTAIAQRPAMGRTAIAAQSLRFTATAFRPIARQECSRESKSTPSMSMSVVQSQ